MLLAVAIVALAAGVGRADEGYLIAFDADQRLQVVPLDDAALGRPLDRAGLVVWLARGTERWAFLDAGQKVPAASQAPPTLLALDGVRGTGGSAAGSGAMPLTTQLAQLRGTAIARDVDSDFVTPPREGLLLTRKPAFRRKAREGAVPFPAATAVLTVQDGKQRHTVRLEFAEGQEKLDFPAVPGLPDGLPAGTHTLALEKGGVGPRPFTVEADDVRRRVLGPVRELAGLVGEAHPLVVQLALEQLLGQTGEEAQPYLTDALDLLDRLPAQERTPALEEQRKRIVAVLALPPEERAQAVTLAPGPLPEPTGVEPIDRARGLVLAGQWSQANDLLGDKALHEHPDARVRGLALLYQAVIFAEAGTSSGPETLDAFAQALALLKDAPAVDRLRAHNNFADYLHGVAQDGLYNHAFQMAAGGQGTFVNVLRAWVGAQHHYRQAFDLAPTAVRPAIALNLARLDLLLGDVVQTIDAGRGRAMAQAAYRRAGEQAEGPAAEKGLTGAQALELRAMAAFRQGDAETCRRHAADAADRYQRAGVLVGVENAHRTLALAAADRADAIKHWRIALVLAEALRERVPADRVGATRAGFFARKAFMYDRLVELQVAAGRPGEALRTAELARSRALQDVLFLSGAGPRPGAAPPLDEILKSWPKDTAALVYFLGGEQALAFLVAPGGEVQAFPLTTVDKQPLRSRELVARVRSFLNGVEHQAARLKDQLTSGRGFDMSWQDRLHEFYQELIPADARPALRQAKTVLVVPNHILHYFPFAALVTEPDRKKRDKFTMASPRFLVDEPFDLCCVPSLTTWGLLSRRPVRPLTEAAALGIVDLPGTPRLDGVAEDLKNLQAAFGPRARTVRTAREVTKAAARAQLRRPGLLLFAMHGENAPDHPLASRLLVFPAGKEDGSLTAGEIYDTEVAADLVVMSACYSGLADRSPLPGDDLFGLQRAFLQAGARTVVAGLWDVYDLTGPELMQSFFGHVAKGTPANTALARSQREFLAKLRKADDGDPFVHPYFWAVYSVLGDPRTGSAPTKTD